MLKPKGKFEVKRAKKSLGQNFLTDPNYIDKIITSLNPQTDETIIEIGAGRGALTERLVPSAGKVIAIEIDRGLVPLLRDDFCEYDNFVLMEKNALEVDFGALVNLQNPNGKTKLVANLPYYISTAILQYLIQFRQSFSELVVMLQKEVVERITASPGGKQRGFLTVLVEAYFESEKLFDVPPTAFHPKPKVLSSVVRLKPVPDHVVLRGKDELFRNIVSLGFAQKRKTIRNNLKNASGELAKLIENGGGVESLLSNAPIEPNKRAEELTLDEWLRITKLLAD